MSIDDSLLRYHYRKIDRWTDNAKYRDAFVIEKKWDDPSPQL